MKTLLTMCLLFTCVASYRDGARENSCYDHSIIHENSEIVPCVPPPAREPCPYFLNIREVVDEGTLELGNETVTDYQCGKIYGSKHIQAREVMTFLTLNNLLQCHNQGCILTHSIARIVQT